MPTDLDAMQKRGEAAKTQGYSEIPFWKEKEGINVIRILPGYAPRTLPFIEYRKVFIRDRKTGFTPRAQFGLDCPFEVHYNNLRKQKDDASKKQLDNIQLRNRVAFIVIDRNDENAGPQVWETNLQNLSAGVW